ncbi:MAG: hypothetical protein R2774_09660 [Saprospiraceae bacterium]
MKTFIGLIFLSVCWLPISQVSFEYFNSAKKNILEKKWQLHRIIESEIEVNAENYWNSLPQCAKDDILIFTDSSLCYIRNEKCTAEEFDKECYKLVWDNGSKFTIGNSEYSITLELVAYQDDALILRYFWYGNEDDENASYFDIEYEVLSDDLAAK